MKPEFLYHVETKHTQVNTDFKEIKRLVTANVGAHVVAGRYSPWRPCLLATVKVSLS